MKEYSIRNTGHVLRYHDLPGEEMPILFVHGLGCAGSFDYPAVAAQDCLSNHRRILVDMTGAGFSDKPDDFAYSVEDQAVSLQELIGALHLGPLILFGHSLGGAVALALADKCRDKVSRLILSESNVDPSPDGSASKRIAGFDMGHFIHREFDKLVKVSRQSGNTMWVAALSLWLPKAVYLMSRSLAAGGDPSWRSILYSLDCPRTYIFGENSLPDPDVRVLAGHGIHVEIVKDAGHSMAWENPQGLAAAISNGIRNFEA